MPPARRTPTPVDPAPLLVEVWTTTAEALAHEPDDGRRAALVAALSGQLLSTQGLLASPHPGPGTVPLHAWLRHRAPPSDPAPGLDRGLQAAVTAVRAATAPVVATRLGPVERRVLLEDRLLRAVALGRDLSDPLVPERPVLRLCARLLARALADRAPGRSVELRVPPHVAVQCVEGPRHTRGTPPNVIEADPVAFLDVAFGRADWTETVSAGCIRASGERADLRPWLPLLNTEPATL